LERFIGGMRVSLSGRTLERWSWCDMDCANASRPLAELTIDGSLLRVRLRYAPMRHLFGRFCPTVETSLESLRAKAVGKTGITRGVILNGASGRMHESVIFWCSKKTQDRLVAALGRLGVTME
jgi:hypothetical protein